MLPFMIQQEKGGIQLLKLLLIIGSPAEDCAVSTAGNFFEG
jgi:hypothetical protein